MAVLEKIRVRFGIVISVIIALALLSFIIDPSTLESALNSMSSKYDVGKIAGKSISYTDFQSEIDKYTTINELLTGSSVQNEQTTTSIRNAAWQSLVDKYSFVKNAKAAGINVGESEMLALTNGDMVSPAIAQNGAFIDENGNFSRENFVSFVQNVDADQTGRLRLYWNFLQNSIYNQQFYTKYGAMFTGSAYENALQLKNDLVENNTTADVEYCLVSYPYADSTLTVSNKEINDFYKSHKDFFKQKASRDIEYVVFEVVPSADDIAKANDDMSKAYEEFASADNMRAFLLKNSERPLSNYWYKEGELSTVNSQIDNSIFSGEKLTPIFQSGNSFFAARELDSQMIPDSAYVKHILLVGDDAKHQADSLAAVVAKGANFSNLVASYSSDQNSNADGELGNIGWMTQTYMIQGFESVLTAAVNKPFVLETQYGTHVVLVSAKTKPILKKQIAVLEKTAIASKETFNTYYAQANTFSSIAAGSYDGYKKALDSTKVYSHSLNVTEATSSYGSIDQAKEVTRWVFDAKKDKASNIITVNNNFFFIAAVKDVNKEGYAPVEKVAASIKNQLFSEKLHEKTRQSVAEKIAGAKTMAEVSERLGVALETNESMSLASASVEPAVLGVASTIAEGTISPAVNGILGVYVVNVTNKQTGSFYTENDAKTMAAQKAQYMTQMISSVMQDYDEVEDNSERFF